MATTAILTVVDASTIVACAGTANRGTPDKPLALGSLNDPASGRNCQSSCIYMLSKAADAIQGQGTSELNVRAFQYDNLQWFNTTMQNELDYLVDFYKFQKLSGPDVFAPGQPANMGAYWQATIVNLAVGQRITYNWCFKITDKRNPSVAWYCYWDPYITLVG